MSAPVRPINVAVLAVPEVTASALYGMVDLFASAGRDWTFLTDGVAGEQRMRPYVVGATTDGFHAANGIWIRPDHGLADAPTPDIVCVPDFFVVPGQKLDGGLAPAVAWLRACHAGGATMASACTGAILLAEAGLLAGCEATTHWAYVAALAAYPGVRVRAERTLVVTGTGGRIVMGGGGTGWQDMALFLIARYVGLKEAREVARFYLLEWHEAGQRPHASMLMAKKAPDAVIARCQEWAALNYASAAPVAAMTRLAGLAKRSFVRRFSKATGMAPLEYVHCLRIEEAKQMLETDEAAVEAIAGEVGYQDASFFARLFRRRVGMTPAQYRRRFAALGRTLTASPDDAAQAIPSALR